MTTASGWRPSLGAWCEAEGVRFRVFAPERRRVGLVLEGPSAPLGTRPLRREEDGHWSGFVRGLEPGALYRYRLDEAGPFPDPASRFQPEGVHGPSQVVDPSAFAWTDAAWSPPPLEELVVYELHVGTFTPEGTFQSAMERLPDLMALGVSAIELMPVADFSGRRSWGYDGVSLFAPARCYGTPDDLRRLVDRAHSLGLAVLLDVVYSHLGPDGAYLGAFSRRYFSESHRTPWGAAMNLDGSGSEHVRAFFTESACHWIHEYRFDGLRLDATHALVDDGPRHFLAELQARVRESTGERPVLLIAEDCRNLVHTVQPGAEGGWGLDAVWADDLHHELRVGLAGDRDGYFRDFNGSVHDIVKTVEDGWFFQGQRSEHFGGPRGTDPRPVPPRRLVVCLQNHDQIGNRALGERLHHQIDAAAWRAASTLLLIAPETPLLFMGQEWGATSPFLYFTDHTAELGPLVTEGRRREFAGFAAFSDPVARERIPDPQAEQTFTKSRLDWEELGREPHAGLLRLYRALLELRRGEHLGSGERDGFHAVALDEDSLALLYGPRADAADNLVAIVRLRGSGESRLPGSLLRSEGETQWRLRLSSEDERFVSDPRLIETTADAQGLRARFSRPGAVVWSAPSSLPPRRDP